MPAPKDLYDYLKYDQELQTRYLLNFLNPGTKPNNDSRYYIDSKEYEVLSESTCSRMSLDVRTKASHYKGLALILNYSFQWSETPEGHDYWSSIYTKLRNI